MWFLWKLSTYFARRTLPLATLLCSLFFRSLWEYFGFVPFELNKWWGSDISKAKPYSGFSPYVPDRYFSVAHKNVNVNDFLTRIDINFRTFYSFLFTYFTLQVRKFHLYGHWNIPKLMTRCRVGLKLVRPPCFPLPFQHHNGAGFISQEPAGPKVFCQMFMASFAHPIHFNSLLNNCFVS